MAFLSSDWEKKSCFNINAHLPSLWILPVHTFAASLWILPVHTFAISVNLTCPHICHLCGSYLSTHLPSLWILPVHTFAIFVEFILSTHSLSLWILPVHAFAISVDLTCPFFSQQSLHKLLVKLQKGNTDLCLTSMKY